jgi:hypothetical protein
VLAKVLAYHPVNQILMAQKIWHVVGFNMFFFPSGKVFYPFNVLPCPNSGHTFVSAVCGSNTGMRRMLVALLVYRRIDTAS